MNFWFTEMQTPDVALSCRTRRLLHSEKTPYQELAVYETVQFGRMLVLDDVIQTTVADEFVYHEMITHVGLNTHPDPRRVLVIGGGDGGSVREILKHTRVEKVTLVEIDGRVIEAARKFLPETSCGFEDPRVEIVVADGIKYVGEQQGAYDVVVVDAPDPVGPAVGLFSASFYRSIWRALAEDGLCLAQTESPFFNRDLISRVYRDMAGVFPLVRLYLACIPTYPGGLWSFTLGSKKYDPLQVEAEKIPDLGTRYYSPAVHKSAFVLPPFVAELVAEQKRG